MKIAVAQLKSVSPYGQSNHYAVEKKEKESPGDYEKRTWRNRAHFDSKGNTFIPPMQFKNCLRDAAAYLSERIKGKGMKTWSEKFRAGVLVTEPIPLGIHYEKMMGTWIFVPSDGKTGGGKRVDKCFPTFPSWEGVVNFYILDDQITEDVFRSHLEQAGKFIGIGYFRPIRGGYWGRFEVVDLEWKDQT